MLSPAFRPLVGATGLLFLASVGCAQDSGLDIWQWRNPVPAAEPVIGLAFGHGLFVAVAVNGTILNSADGASWKGVGVPSTNALEAATFQNGTFVTVGGDNPILGARGAIYSSPDGVHWFRQDPHQAPFLWAVASGKGQLAAVGNTGTILISSDGTNWAKMASGTTQALYGAAYGTGAVVAVGLAGTVLSSTDGTNWLHRSSAVAQDLFAAAYGNGTFVAVGATNVALTSPDGVQWTARSTGVPSTLNAVIFVNGQFIAVGSNGAILTSSDGVTWVSEASPAVSTLWGLASGNGVLVAAGSNAYLTSADGVTWTNHSFGSTRNVFDIASGGGKLVAVGGSTFSAPPRPALLVSDDGSNWVSQSVATNFDLYGVGFANGIFTIIGASGLILSSSDTTNWAIRNQGFKETTSDGYPLGGVAFGNGIWVASNRRLGNTCLTSNDGLTWTNRTLLKGASFVEVGRVRFLNGLFVGAGVQDNNGGILTSIDGLTWTKRNAQAINGVNDCAYGNGRFVAVGDLATIRVSIDSTNWTNVNLPASLSTHQFNLHGIHYEDGIFVVVGDAGTVLTSSDGLVWQLRQTPGYAALNGVTFDNGTFVAAGLTGNIWQSGPVLTVDGAWQGKSFLLTLTGPAGVPKRLQSSDELTSWTDLIIPPATNGFIQITDTNAAASSKRFYRVVSP